MLHSSCARILLCFSLSIFAGVPTLVQGLVFIHTTFLMGFGRISIHLGLVEECEVRLGEEAAVQGELEGMGVMRRIWENEEETSGDL
jgi:hypothetical protein